jgi:hypothetical protein
LLDPRRCSDSTALVEVDRDVAWCGDTGPPPDAVAGPFGPVVDRRKGENAPTTTRSLLRFLHHTGQIVEVQVTFTR